MEDAKWKDVEVIICGKVVEGVKAMEYIRDKPQVIEISKQDVIDFQKNSVKK